MLSQLSPTLCSGTLLALTLASIGCDREGKRRESAVGDVEVLANDLCLQGWLEEDSVRRTSEAIRAGRLPTTAVDDYRRELSKAVDRGKKANMSNDSFCRMQRNLWRKHIKR